MPRSPQPDTGSPKADDLIVVSNDAFFGQEVQERRAGSSDPVLLYRIRDVAGVEAGPDCVALIDIDSFGGISRCFDALRLVRRLVPERPVIIASRSFRYDDLSLERAPVCDASLAWPAGAEGLKAGMAVAVANNRILQGRRAEAAQAAEDPARRGDGLQYAAE